MQYQSVTAETPTESRSIFLDDLAPLPQWVAWREELRPGTSKPTKVPFDPTRLPKAGDPPKASSTDPATWGALAQAENAAARLHGAGRPCGTGLVLGTVADRPGLILGGVDLDTCRDAETGRLAEWAQEVIDRLASYAEVSPSKTGVKVFFTCAEPDAATIREALGGKFGRTFKRQGGDHPPGIEFNLGARYFTVTRDALCAFPDEFRDILGDVPPVLKPVALADLLWLIEEHGPTFAGAERTETAAAAVRDESGSGVAFRKAVALTLDGGTIEDFEAWAVENPWGDYHHDADRAMRRTWERAEAEAGKIALNNRRRGKAERFEAAGLNFVRAADSSPEPVSWLWPSRLARGKLTMVAGDPSMGKSQITLDVAARLSSGAAWPDGGQAPRSSVLILSAEDAIGDTMVPRLMAAQADRRQIHILQSVATQSGVRSFSLQADLAALGAKVAELGDLAAVIIDPITSYMGAIDSHRTTDVRAVLEPMAEWAERHDVAILAVTHPPKAAQAKAIHALTGSLAFAAAARLVFLAIAEPETGRSLLLPVKNNLGPKAAGLGYRIVGAEVGKGIATSRIEWDSEAVRVTADEAVQADQTASRKTRPVNEAENFLRNLLGFGEQPASDVKAAAEEAGIAPRTLARAKSSLGVEVRKDGSEGGWLWHLPG